MYSTAKGRLCKDQQSHISVFPRNTDLPANKIIDCSGRHDAERERKREKGEGREKKMGEVHDRWFN